MWRHPLDHYRWLPEAEIAKVRSMSLPLGWLSILVSLILGLPFVLLQNQLPIAGHPATGLVTIAGAAPAVLLLVSAKIMFSLRLWVQSGYMNWRQNYNSKAVLIVFFSISIFMLCLFFLFYILIANNSQSPVEPSVSLVFYLALPVATMIPLAANMFFVNRIIRLSNDLYRQYGPVPPHYLYGSG